MTTTPMKRAGQLIAHLDTLYQIRDVRQLLLLQLSMRERQDQAVLFKRQGGQVTLSLIGTQLSPHSETLQHRAGSVSAAVLLSQLQALSGIAGDDVAFSSGQIAGLVDAETSRIEQSDGLARLDAVLMSLASKLELQPEPEQAGPAQGNPEQGNSAQSTGSEAESSAPGTDQPQDDTADQIAAQDTVQNAGEDGHDSAELVAGGSSGRAARRRS
jgi:hypothetical protein